MVARLCHDQQMQEAQSLPAGGTMLRMQLHLAILAAEQGAESMLGAMEHSASHPLRIKESTTHAAAVRICTVLDQCQ